MTLNFFYFLLSNIHLFCKTFLYKKNSVINSLKLFRRTEIFNQITLRTYKWLLFYFYHIFTLFSFLRIFLVKYSLRKHFSLLHLFLPSFFTDSHSLSTCLPFSFGNSKPTKMSQILVCTFTTINFLSTLIYQKLQKECSKDISNRLDKTRFKL